METGGLNLVASWFFAFGIPPSPNPFLQICIFTLDPEAGQGWGFEATVQEVSFTYFPCVPSSWVRNVWHLSLFSAPVPIFLDASNS